MSFFFIVSVLSNKIHNNNDDFLLYFEFRTLEDFALPRIITEITGQTTVPIGDGVIATKDTVLGRSIFF